MVLRKELTVWFPADQGSTGVEYRLGTVSLPGCSTEYSKYQQLNLARLLREFHCVRLQCRKAVMQTARYAVYDSYLYSVGASAVIIITCAPEFRV